MQKLHMTSAHVPLVRAESHSLSSLKEEQKSAAPTVVQPQLYHYRRREQIDGGYLAVSATDMLMYFLEPVEENYIFYHKLNVSP